MWPARGETTSSAPAMWRASAMEWRAGSTWRSCAPATMTAGTSSVRYLRWLHAQGGWDEQRGVLGRRAQLRGAQRHPGGHELEVARYRRRTEQAHEHARPEGAGDERRDGVPHQVTEERERGRRHERHVEPRSREVVARREHHAARFGRIVERVGERDQRAERMAKDDRALHADPSEQRAQQRGLRARSPPSPPRPRAVAVPG